MAQLRITERVLARTMSWTHADVVLLTSVASSLVFLFYSSFKSRKLPRPLIPTTASWQSLSRVVRLLNDMDKIGLLTTTAGF